MTDTRPPRQRASASRPVSTASAWSPSNRSCSVSNNRLIRLSSATRINGAPFPQVSCTASDSMGDELASGTIACDIEGDRATLKPQRVQPTWNPTLQCFSCVRGTVSLCTEITCLRARQVAADLRIGFKDRVAPHLQRLRESAPCATRENGCCTYLPALHKTNFTEDCRDTDTCQLTIAWLPK